MPLHVKTPLLRSTALSHHHGAPVWLKLESAQPSGSFKLRGMARACETAIAGGAARIITSSGGNAGLAVAWACRQLGVPAIVVVPRRTAPRMRALIAAEEAEVRVHGEVWDDAHAHALELAPALDGAVVHPFDDPEVWAGHASLVTEVAAELPEPPEAFVVAVGGGGLLCGVMAGLHAVAWSHVPVLAVETTGAASYAAALSAGTAVTLPAIDSLALTLGAKRVCDRSVQWASEHPVTPWQCTDAQAVAACSAFLDDHRILVEPACGAGLAAIYADRGPLAGRSVVVVVCGGASVTRAQLADWEAQVRSPRETSSSVGKCTVAGAPLTVRSS